MGRNKGDRMIGIIILNYETWDLSLRCMKSLLEQEGAEQDRIYLVDNASRTPMPEEVKNFVQQHAITFIASDANRGYAAGNNLGVKQAMQDGCDALLISNNDIIYEPGSVQNMYQSLQEKEKIGIVGPKVINENGEAQPSRVSRKTGIKEVFELYTVAKIFFRRQWKTYFCLDQPVDKPAYVYHVSGCCFMISAECAKQVLPFDEATVLYDEELILGIHMEQAGFKTLYQPNSVVVHKHGATTERVKPFMYQCISESELYYCSKYLKCGKIPLWFLYQYRRLLYCVRRRKDKKLKEYWPSYKNYTRQCYERAIQVSKGK
ncbi:MAG: glycosyltransferase family 2 protein [Lachnospiraceae bacterium]